MQIEMVFNGTTGNRLFILSYLFCNVQNDIFHFFMYVFVEGYMQIEKVFNGTTSSRLIFVLS